jgi:esterase
MRLHFQARGAGFPLLIVHGFLGSLDNWRATSQRLSDHYTVYRIDLRNHGLSPHSDAMSYELMAQDLREFVDLRGLPSSFLLGHSMGGKVAMQFAADCPDRVAKLAVVDIAPRAYEPYHRPILNALLALDLTIFKSFAQVDGALAEAIPDIGVRQFLLKNLSRDQGGGLRWKIPLQALARNYDALAAAIRPRQSFTKPTCFIRGGRSNYITEEDIPLIQATFPHARIETIPEAGHWVHMDALEAFLRCVMEFFDET